MIQNPETRNVPAVPLQDPADTPGGWYLRHEAADDAQFRRDQAEMAPMLKYAAATLLDAMSHLMTLGYGAEAAAGIVGIGPSDPDHLDSLRDAGVREGHLLGPGQAAWHALEEKVRDRLNQKPVLGRRTVSVDMVVPDDFRALMADADADRANNDLLQLRLGDVSNDINDFLERQLEGLKVLDWDWDWLPDGNGVTLLIRTPDPSHNANFADEYKLCIGDLTGETPPGHTCIPAGLGDSAAEIRHRVVYEINARVFGELQDG